MDNCDHLVIGAGSAGCVLANRLSADPTNRVILLEAGGRDSYPWIHIPVGYLYCINNPRTDWCFRTEAEPGLNGRSLIYPRGRVLGGSSSINGMIYMRGQAQDYDAWAQMGCTGWGWEDVLPLFRAQEDHWKGGDAFHGSGGEWRVEKARLRWDVLDAFRDAALQAGMPESPDFNRGDNEGVGYYEVNQRRGIRWNASKAFLRPIKARANLQVWTGAEVERLLIEAGRVVGAIVHHQGQRREIRAARETVLSAGAVGSVQILERSGIGRPEVLKAVGITPVAEVAELGQNLQDHLQLRMIYKVQGVTTLNALASSIWGKARIGMEYALRRSGPMAMAPSQLGILTRSRPDVATPDLQFHVQPVSLDKFGDPLHPFPAMTSTVCNLRPESRGSVHVTSADHRAAPSIRPNYLSTEGDLQVAVAAMRITRQIVAQPAFQRLHPEEFRPGAALGTEAELKAAAADIATTIFHPVGTCRMGADAGAVVDPRLRLKALGGLRIADASVMPRITSGNTNSPTLMIAEKAARMMLEEGRGA